MTIYHFVCAVGPVYYVPPQYPSARTLSSLRWVGITATPTVTLRPKNGERERDASQYIHEEYKCSIDGKPNYYGGP